MSHLLFKNAFFLLSSLDLIGSAATQNETRSITVSTVESLPGEGTCAGTFAFYILPKSLR